MPRFGITREAKVLAGFYWQLNPESNPICSIPETNPVNVAFTSLPSQRGVGRATAGRSFHYSSPIWETSLCSCDKIFVKAYPAAPPAAKLIMNTMRSRQVRVDCFSFLSGRDVGCPTNPALSCGREDENVPSFQLTNVISLPKCACGSACVSSVGLKVAVTNGHAFGESFPVVGELLGLQVRVHTSAIHFLSLDWADLPWHRPSDLRVLSVGPVAKTVTIQFNSSIVSGRMKVKVIAHIFPEGNSRHCRNAIFEFWRTRRFLLRRSDTVAVAKELAGSISCPMQERGDLGGSWRRVDCSRSIATRHGGTLRQVAPSIGNQSDHCRSRTQLRSKSTKILNFNAASRPVNSARMRQRDSRKCCKLTEAQSVLPLRLANTGPLFHVVAF